MVCTPAFWRLQLQSPFSMNLPSAAFNPKRLTPGTAGSWSGHLPFARDLVTAVRPQLFVELGTGHGESYFGFCQAIAENAIDCRAYAVGGWRGAGQPETGSESYFQELRCYNDSNYSGFSYLLEKPVREALAQFEHESIGILHLDGVRAFNAATDAFNEWLPKVRPGGIILLPNIVARHDDFDIWKLWNSLRNRGETFEFHHSSGLGVFEKPSPQTARCDFLNVLFSGDPSVEAHLRRYYSLSAMELERKRSLINSAPNTNPDSYVPQSASDSNDCLSIDEDQAQLCSPPIPETHPQLQSLERERDALIEQSNAQQTRIYLLTESHAALKELQKKYAELEKTNEALQEDHQNLEQSFQRLINQYQGLERTFQGVINSHSWKITSPLRSLLQLLSPRPR